MCAQKLLLRLAVIQVVAVVVWAEAGTVKVTPLGSRTGDFCVQDRALLFEDPTGVRILYDPGNTVRGGTDARLGAVDAILLSHAHGDHIGGSKLEHDPNASDAPCAPGSKDESSATPSSNAAEIAAAKNSAVFAGSPLATFLGLRIAQLLGKMTTPGCAVQGLGNELIVPLAGPCTGLINPGGKRTLRRASATRGVQVAAVTAEHPGEIASAFLTDPASDSDSDSLKKELSANNVSAYGGLANGFIVKFTNGLTAYLSGDTGLTSDMETVVNRFYHANLTVINISDTFVTGPEEAAFAVRSLVKAKAVIPSHANEIATTGGMVNAGTRTARFIELLHQRGNEDAQDSGDGGGPVVFVPRSGITLEFDGQAHCRAGCN